MKCPHNAINASVCVRHPIEGIFPPILNGPWISYRSIMILARIKCLMEINEQTNKQTKEQMPSTTPPTVLSSIMGIQNVNSNHFHLSPIPISHR